MTEYQINKAEVIVLTSGEYSDFGIDAFVVALKDFNIYDKTKEYIAQLKPDEDSWGVDRHEFISWLVIKEYLMACSYREVHLGSYSRLFNLEVD